MGWREDVKIGIGRIGTLYLGDTNGQMGVEINSYEFTSLNAAAVTVGADDGTLGVLTLWPDTVDKGSLVLECQDNSGDDIYTLRTPLSTAAAVDLTLPDVTGYVVAGTAQITLAEANVLDGAIVGTQVASKAVIANSDVNIGVVKATELHIGATSGEIQVTSTPAELNQLDGGWDSIETVSEEGAGGLVVVQLQFKDAAGVNMAVPVSGVLWFADEAEGLTHSAAIDGSVVVETNGSIVELTAAHNIVHFITAADGKLGFTITATADSFWGVFKHPTGLSIITDELISD
jgi:hypothetical protein